MCFGTTEPTFFPLSLQSIIMCSTLRYWYECQVIKYPFDIPFFYRWTWPIIPCQWLVNWQTSTYQKAYLRNEADLKNCHNSWELALPSNSTSYHLPIVIPYIICLALIVWLSQPQQNSNTNSLHMYIQSQITFLHLSFLLIKKNWLKYSTTLKKIINELKINNFIIYS